MKYHPTGQPILAAMTTSTANSFPINFTNPGTVAPSVLRMPSSFVRRSAENADSPNNPKQEIKIERIASALKSLPRCPSSL
jgi:hypothetical protein